MFKYNGLVQDSSGNVVTSATITVYDQNTGTPSTIYQDNESSTWSNPFTVSDTNYETDGSYYFKAANGIYDIKVVIGGDTTWLYDVVFLDNTDRQLKSIKVNGVLFNGDTAAANTLDDYEEGTFTPVLSDGSNNATASVAVGKYTKKGNEVSITIAYISSNLGSVSGAIRLTGLPFANIAAEASFDIGFGSSLLITAGYSCSGFVAASGSYVNLQVWDGTGGTSDMQESEFTANGFIMGKATYYTT